MLLLLLLVLLLLIVMLVLLGCWQSWCRGDRGRAGPFYTVSLSSLPPPQSPLPRPLAPSLSPAPSPHPCSVCPSLCVRAHTRATFFPTAAAAIVQAVTSVDLKNQECASTFAQLTEELAQLKLKTGHGTLLDSHTVSKGS